MIPTPQQIAVISGNAVSGPTVNSNKVALGTGSAGIFDSGNAEGWTIFCATCSVGQTIPATRQGFTATTVPVLTTYNESFTVTSTVRNAIGRDVSLAQPNIYALSRYVLATDILQGFANNSTIIAAQPVCLFDEPDRRVIGNVLHASAACFSQDARNGSEIAALVFTAAATDGTAIGSCTSTSMQISAYPGDQNPVLDYECDIPVSGAADNIAVKLDGKAYPWYGDVRSVLDSATNTATAFTTRYYLRNTGKAAGGANVWYAYICPTVSVGGCPATAGNDTNGLWSKDPAVAAATPFATGMGPINASNGAHGIAAVNGGVGVGNAVGALDGAIIRLGAGQTSIAGRANGAKVQALAAVTFTRDPLVTRAQAVFTSTGGVQSRIGDSGNVSANGAGQIDFRDMTFLRTVSTAMFGNYAAGANYTFDNVTFDNGSSGWGVGLNGGQGIAFWGTTYLNNGSNTLASVSMFRGFSSTTASLATYSMGSILGSTFSGLTQFTAGGSGSVFAFNKLLNLSNGSIAMGFGATPTVGVALVQNLVECTGTTGTAGFLSLSYDAGGAGINGEILQYNTFTGVGAICREFNNYDQTVGSPRVYQLNSSRGNIYPLYATKSDIFDSFNQHDTTVGIGSPNNRTGSWSTMYGVNHQGDFHMVDDTGSGGCCGIQGGRGGMGGFFEMTFPGFGSIWNKSATSINDNFFPGWVNYQGTTNGGTGALVAGAGGGDYHLAGATFTGTISGTTLTVSGVTGTIANGLNLSGPSVVAGQRIVGGSGTTWTLGTSQANAGPASMTAVSPCKGIVTYGMLPFTLDGTPRPVTNDSCGAF
ncbi:MAG: hypothetical protein ACRYG4_17205 [Janthinobacterium lividum]